VISYLSGAMENAKDGGANWRKEITSWLIDNLNHGVFDPFVESQELMKNYEEKEFRRLKQTDPKKYVEVIRIAIKNDLDAVVNKADYLICLWDENVFKGAGTHSEVTFAYYYEKPIYLVNKLPICDLSGWIMSCATEMVDDFESLKVILKNKYPNDINRS
tara:strand:+ start:650 stop:1129 length:480 start_codon:yes stop_codon:yes gene_type:complete